MKKLLKKVMMCATMMAALVGFTSCEDDLDIQTNYPFEVEVMPVPTKVLRGQTVEIRCHLAKEGDYTHTLYTIRWFLYDGTGSLRMENGTILQPNDRYLLENETFRLYYTSASTDAHKFIVVVEDSNGNSQRWGWRGRHPTTCHTRKSSLKWPSPASSTSRAGTRPRTIRMSAMGTNSKKANDTRHGR